MSSGTRRRVHLLADSTGRSPQVVGHHPAQPDPLVQIQEIIDQAGAVAGQQGVVAGDEVPSERPRLVPSQPEGAVPGATVLPGACARPGREGGVDGVHQPLDVPGEQATHQEAAAALDGPVHRRRRQLGRLDLRQRASRRRHRRGGGGPRIRLWPDGGGQLAERLVPQGREAPVDVGAAVPAHPEEEVDGVEAPPAGGQLVSPREPRPGT